MEKFQKIKTLTVFCGSQSGANPVFVAHAAQLGKTLATQKITLVYGGGNKGLMGALANACLDAGGRVIGIIPKILAVPEHAHDHLTQLIKVDDMHIRKKMLYQRGDAAVVLAGGFGTMDEFFEFITWNQLHIHHKRVWIINSAGFYDPLVAQLKSMEEGHFLYQPVSMYITVVSSPEEIDFN